LRATQLNPVKCNATEVAKTGQPSRERVASSQRAIAILDVLAEEGPLGTTAIARRSGMQASTISRQLGTLVDSGLVEYDSDSGRYRLGLRLVQLANAVLTRLDVRAVARPHLEALVAAVGETATLSVPVDPHAVTIDFVPTQRYVQGVTHLGRPSIAHATAAGKVMLASTDRRPRPPLEAYTEKTITDPEALDQELALIRERGWADAFEEREPGLNAIAAPVWSSGGDLAGIVALQGPVPRFGRAAARAALPLLLEHTREISSELGWTSA
jgi:DNA-binding IclR family transcriptional regulator